MDHAPTRSRWLAAAVAIAAAGALVGVALATSGGEEADGLRLERSATGMVVYLADPADNEPGTADGASSVMLECLDGEGRLLVRAAQPWPFTDTDGQTLDPHVHLALQPELLGQVERCRLKGTDLEGGLL